MKTTSTLFWAVAAATVVLYAVDAYGNPCCTRVVTPVQEYRLEYSTISEPVEHTSYRKVAETQYVDEEVTTYETVWETQQRERRYTVSRVVPETSVTQRRYTVNKPVDEVEYRDTSYNVTRTVPETSERVESYLVAKQVYETQQREVVETRRVPVQETRIQERLYTVNRPVTTYTTQTVDRGQYVDSVSVQPGRTYHRLAWQRAGNYYDPATGTSRWRFPGLFWTPMQGEAHYSVSKVYQPNFVTETTPVTAFMPEQRIEQVPVTTTTFREEQVSRIEQVQVPKTVQEEVVRRVPVTTYKQVVERVEQKTPVTVRKYVAEERVEEVPVTTYKTVTEERVEPYEVKVAKLVPVTRTVRKPVTVEKWVPFSYTVEKKRVVVNRIPIENGVTVVDTGTSARLNPGERLVGPVVDREVTTEVRTLARPSTAPQVVETEEVAPAPSTFVSPSETVKPVPDSADTVPVIKN